MLFLLLWSSLPLSADAVEYAYAPVAGTMTSPFGWRTDPIHGHSRFHGGVDIAAPMGSPVYAPQDGVVIYSGDYGGYGNVVVLQHSGDLYTLYGHNAYLLVKYGDRVGKGQMISMVGSTGRSTGPHLHFEVRQGNGYVNPLEYLSYLQSTGGGYSLTHGSVARIYAVQQTANRSSGSVSRQPVTVGQRPTSTSRSTSRSHRTKKHGWNVEVIKGDDVEMVEF